jgi:hypothetical protein
MANRKSGEQREPCAEVEHRRGSDPLTALRQVALQIARTGAFYAARDSPVYLFSQGRYYEGSLHMGEFVRQIVGLVSAEQLVTEQVKSELEETVKKYKLSLAKIIPAPFIRQVIELAARKR